MSASVHVHTAVYVFAGLLAGAFDKHGLSTNYRQGGAGPQQSEPVTGGQRSRATCPLKEASRGLGGERDSKPRPGMRGAGRAKTLGRLGQLRLEANSITPI